MLVACFAIKLFGGNWFEVVCTNEHFSNFCEYVENNRAVYVPFSLFVYIIPTLFVILSVCNKPKPNKEELLFFLISLLVIRLSRYISTDLKSVLELLFILLVPFILDFVYTKDIKNSFKKNWYRGIVGNALVLLFQTISLLTKNVGLKLLNDNLVVTYILLIDYYIMITLYYLYIKLKSEVKING
jgi:hypothetical protein